MCSQPHASDLKISPGGSSHTTETGKLQIRLIPPRELVIKYLQPTPGPRHQPNGFSREAAPAWSPEIQAERGPRGPTHGEGQALVQEEPPPQTRRTSPGVGPEARVRSDQLPLTPASAARQLPGRDVREAGGFLGAARGSFLKPGTGDLTPFPMSPPPAQQGTPVCRTRRSASVPTELLPVSRAGVTAVSCFPRLSPGPPHSCLCACCSTLLGRPSLHVSRRLLAFPECLTDGRASTSQHSRSHRSEKAGVWAAVPPARPARSSPSTRAS